MMEKSQDVLTLLEKLSKIAPQARTLCNTHPDGRSLYVSSKQYNLLMTEDAEVFVLNDHKPPFFQTNSFHKHARVLPGEMHSYSLQRDLEKVPTIALFFLANFK